MMSPEFEQMMHDPDLQAERGPGGTLVFQDGDAYCVVGPEFVSVEESDCYAFGETRDDAIANYAARVIPSRGTHPLTRGGSDLCEFDAG